MNTNILWLAIPAFIFFAGIMWWNVRVRHETPTKAHWLNLIGLALMLVAFGLSAFRSASWFWYVWVPVLAIAIVFFFLSVFENIRRKSRQE